MSERISTDENVGPILLDGSLHETIWGGRSLGAKLGKALPEGARIGESWETANESIARTARYAGMTLGELTTQLGERLIGWRSREVFGLRFPLLAKFIDAQQPLSVQVHPNDAYAAHHEGGKLGKTEVWYILHAQPGARLVYGLEREATQDEVREAIVETRLESLLHSFNTHAGDVIFVPAGTIHAICDGIVLYELQEYSDVTYRLYDYGRLQADGKPRELHVDRGLDVMRFTPPLVDRVQPLKVSDPRQNCTRSVLTACRYFVLEEQRFDGHIADNTRPSSCEILTVLGGTCSLRAGGEELRLGLGNTVVLPATLGEYHLEGENAWMVRSYVPVEDDADLAAWRAAQPSSLEL